MISFHEPKININNIYNLDCIGFINEIRKNKIVVDAIITDPPYNISRKNNFSTIGRKGIDFGNWDKEFDQFEWLENIDEIIKSGGSLIIFNDWKNIGEIAKFLETKGFEIKDVIRWVKTNPMPRNVNRRYVTDYELALWAIKKGKWTFNKDPLKHYLKPEYIGTPPMGTKRIHPTQKSGDVIKNIIKTHTNEGDLVFDPFSGSGEISLAAKELNRNYIACEIDESYYKLSLSRFDNVKIFPAFNHIGNKRRIIKEIIKNLPQTKITNFIDVFAGSGVVSANYNKARKYFLNDNDPNIKKILKYLFNNKKDVVINDIKEIISFYNLPFDKIKDYKNEYQKLKNDFNFKKDNIKFNPSAMLFVLVIFGFNQQIRFNSKDEFNIPAGKFYFSKYQELKITKFINSVEKTKVEIENEDFEKFVNNVCKEIKTQDSVFYFDPPYLITNGTYNLNWTEEEEDRLLNLLNRLNNKKIKWVLSNQLYSNKKTNILLLDFLIKNKDLKIKKIDISYSNSNYQRKNHDKDLEIVVRNF